jgi:hypothetical protein
MSEFSRRGLVRAGAGAILGGGIGAACASAPEASASAQKVWVFDRLEGIGGVTTHVEGEPVLIDSPFGPAVQFDGVDDALYIDEHPLAGAATFTFEVLFRPDGGAFEQRWFHLQQLTPDAGAEAGAAPVSRIMFEIRVVEGGWYLDAFTRGPGYNQPLIFPDKLFPIGQWAQVAQSYDGRFYRSYVDGALQGEAEIRFTAQGEGHTSVGTRINRVNYFNGAVREARFTPRALTPAEFTSLL